MFYSGASGSRSSVNMSWRAWLKEPGGRASTDGSDEMTIQVECHAGYRGDEEPRAFTIGERRLIVRAVQDRWAGPDYRYFRVTASDDDTYVLRHDERAGEWTLGAFRRT